MSINTNDSGYNGLELTNQLLQGKQFCRFKRFDAFVCKPVEGSIIIDRLNYPNIYKALGRDFFNASEIDDALSKKLLSLCQREVFSHVTKSKPYVLCGPLKDLHLIDEKTLINLFDFVFDGSVIPITFDEINKRCNDLNYMTWKRVRFKPDSYPYKNCECAVKVPLDKKGRLGLSYVNQDGIDHGKGDFLVIRVDEHRRPLVKAPDFIRVVNGVLFKELYNNFDFSLQLTTKTVQSVTLHDLPTCLIPSGKDINSNSISYLIRQISLANTYLINRYLLVNHGVAANIASYSEKLEIEGVPVEDSAFVWMHDSVSLRIASRLTNAKAGETPSVMKITSKDNSGNAYDYVFSLNGQNLEVSNVPVLSVVNAANKLFGRITAGVESNFSYNAISALDCYRLIEYSKNSMSMNAALFSTLPENEDKTNLAKYNFNVFIFAYQLHNFLKGCRLHQNVTLYKGVSFEVKEGTEINSNYFLSTSLSLPAAAEFCTGDKFAILQFNNTNGVFGFYLNTISNYRNTEWEVLLDAVYRIRVGAKLFKYGKIPVYEAELVQFTNPKIEIYKEIEEHEHLKRVFDIIMRSKEYLAVGSLSEYNCFEKSHEDAQLDYEVYSVDLLNKHYGKSINPCAVLNIAEVKSPDKTQVLAIEFTGFIYDEENPLAMKETGFVRKVDTSLGSYEFYAEVNKIIQEFLSSVSVTTVSSVVFMLRNYLAEAFKSKHFVIKHSYYYNRGDRGLVGGHTKAMKFEDMAYFEFELSGNKTDDVKVLVRVEKEHSDDIIGLAGKLKIDVIVQDNGTDYKRTLFASLDTLDKVANDIYKFTVSSASLRCNNRLNRIFALLSLYWNTGFVYTELESGKYKYSINRDGISPVIIEFKGDKLVYTIEDRNASVEYPYFYDLSAITRRLYVLLTEKVKTK